jgi:hypothetical protein
MHNNGTTAQQHNSGHTASERVGKWIRSDFIIPTSASASAIALCKQTDSFGFPSDQ